jgi:zinc transport system substrate-binding protein
MSHVLLAAIAAAMLAAGPVRVFTAVVPHAGLVEAIGGPHVSLEVLVRPDQDPHTYEPTPRQMTALSAAQVLFTARMPFEKVLIAKLREALPSLKIVDTAEGAACRKMESHHEPHHAHGGAEEELDPHVWLGPAQLAVQARNVASALSALDPGHAGEYEVHLAAFLEALDAVDARNRARLEPYRGRSFVVFHPAFGYFADAYGLKQEPVEMEGKSPTPRQLQELIARMRAAKTRVVFVQPQFDPRTAETIAAAIGGRVMTLNDMGRDVLANLEDLAARLEEAFQ